MSERCRVPEAVAETGRPGSSGKPEGAEWQAHLTECGTCRVQWRTHDALRVGLGHTPLPVLSTGFDRRLAFRLKDPAPEAILGSRARAILAGYWLVALAGSVAVVAATMGPPSAPGAAEAGLFLLAVPASFAFLARPDAWSWVFRSPRTEGR